MLFRCCFIVSVITAATAFNRNIVEDVASVRDLDSYGTAVQLQHATAAATQRGRLIIALIVNKERKIQSKNIMNVDESFISSVQIKDSLTAYPASRRDDAILTNDGLDENEDDFELWIITPCHSKNHPRSRQRHCRDQTIPPLLHPMHTAQSLNDDHDSALSSCTYVSCCGVQGDALWLIQQLQRYVTTLWERYNYQGSLSLHNSAVVTATTQLLQSFWEYNNDDSVWQGPAWKTLSKDDHKWARPLGVRVLVCHLTATSLLTAKKRCRRAQLCILEPSGIVSEHVSCPARHEDINDESGYPLVCMGRRGEEIYKLLQDRLACVKTADTQSDAKDSLDMNDDNDHESTVLKQVVSVLSSAFSEMDADELYMETVSADLTVRHKRIPLQRTQGDRTVGR